MASKKKLIFGILKFIISGALIFWILRGTNFGDILTAMETATIPLLLVAFCLHFVGHYISALRWRLLLKAQGVSAPLLFLIKSYMVGMFFNNLLPSIIGGDAVRAYDSWRVTDSKAKALAVVFVDRFLGIFALVLFALAAVFFSPELTSHLPLLPVGITLGTALMSGITAFIFLPSPHILKSFGELNLPLANIFGSLIRKITDPFMAFQGKQDALFGALWLSVLLQINVVIHYYLIAKALSFPIPFHSFFLIIPLATFIMMLPISIGGIGVRESTFAFFFATYGVSKPEAVAFAWIAYGIVLIHGLLGGVMYALRK